MGEGSVLPRIPLIIGPSSIGFEVVLPTAKMMKRQV